MEDKTMNVQRLVYKFGVLVVSVIIFLSQGGIASQQGIDPATERLQILSESAKPEDIVEIRKLIKANANINARNNLGVTPLFTASKNGNIEVVALLLDAKAEPLPVVKTKKGVA